MPYAESCLGTNPEAVVVAASDYVKALPCSIRPWVSGEFVALGTDGFGRSEGRTALRDYFEVDSRHVAFATLCALSRKNRFPADRLVKAMSDLGIDADKPDPTAI